MLDALAPARRRLVVVAAAVLLAGLGGVGVVLGAGLLGGDGAAAPVRQDVAGPVLLVPGYGGGTRSLERLAVVLRDAGKEVSVVRLPDGALGDLNRQADAVEAAAEAAMRRTGARSVDLVGYSAGGVVARLVATGDGSSYVRRLVTLGSPHHGTQLATLGGMISRECGVACHQLATESDLLTRLEGASLPAGVPFVSVYSTLDEVIVPATSSRVPGATNVEVQSLCPASQVEHGELPTDEVVQRVVQRSLTTGPVPAFASAWSSATCQGLGA